MVNITRFFPEQLQITITSTTSPLTECPKGSTVLISYFVVNLCEAGLALIIGNRAIVKAVTFHRFGRPESKSWQVMWILHVGLQLGANALIAWLLTWTAGYATSASIWEWTMFLLLRPRLSYLLIGIFGNWRDRKGASLVPFQVWRSKEKSSPEEPVVEEAESTPSSPTLLPQDSNCASEDTTINTEIPYYASAAATQIIGESFLQIASLIYMGTTVRFASTQDYLDPQFTNYIYYDLPASAHLIYGSALYYVIGGSISLYVILATVTGFYTGGRVEKPGGGKNDLILWEWLPTFSLLLLATTAIASWIWWIGFLQLLGDQYCHPKLCVQGVIWIIASSAAVFLGTGV